MSVHVIGGGITGLTLALALHRAGIPCRVYEAASTIRRLGVGINLQPHGVRALSGLGLEDALAKVAVATSEMGFYNRFGQRIYTEPRGRAAGYDWPQFSVHRGELHRVQLAAVHARLGMDSVVLDHRCVAVEQDNDGVTLRFADHPPVRGSVAIACDGIHSVVRKQCYPAEGEPLYEGINMWRGTTRWRPFLTGTSMVQVGWLDVGKLVIYPIEPRPDDQGMQQINWVAEYRSPRQAMADWNRGGRLDDFFPHFANWTFDWLDVPGMLRNAPPDTILRLVHERTGDRPFARIDDVISAQELLEISDRYKKIAGFDRAALNRSKG